MQKEIVKQSSLGIILVVVGLLLGMLVMYVLVRPTKKTYLPIPKMASKIKNKFSGPVLDIEGANENLDAMHEEDVYDVLNFNWMNKTYGIVHDPDDLFTDFKAVYENFVATHANNIPSGYKWTVGLYYNIVGTDVSNAKLNVYFIPTLYNTAKKKVIDYHLEYNSNDKNDPYAKYLSGAWPADKSYIFDQGTLFP